MKFDFNEQQESIRRDLVCLAQSIDLGDLEERDRNSVYSKEAFTQLSKSGMNTWLDNREGKPGFNATELSIALETMGEHCEDSGLVFSIAAHLCACIHPIVYCASEHQKREWMDKIITNHWLGAHAITEVQAGSDVFAMQTFAEKVDGGFIINGEKTYITNAPHADFIVLHAKTSNNGNLFDFTSFIFPSHLDGITLSKTPKEKVGLRTAAMGDIHLNNVFVSDDMVIGQVGSGLPLFTASMEWERTCLFALYVGLMKRQLKQTVKYAEQRQQFGKSIIDNQAIGHSIVDMYTAYERSRLLLYKSSSLLDQGRLDGLSSNISKIEISYNAVNNSRIATEIHGAMGVVAGEIERQYRNTIPSRILSGTTATLKNNALQKIRKAARLNW